MKKENKNTGKKKNDVSQKKNTEEPVSGLCANGSNSGKLVNRDGGSLLLTQEELHQLATTLKPLTVKVSNTSQVKSS